MRKKCFVRGFAMNEVEKACVFFIIVMFYAFIIAISIATIHFSVFFLGGFGRPVGALLVAAFWFDMSSHFRQLHD